MNRLKGRTDDGELTSELVFTVTRPTFAPKPFEHGLEDEIYYLADVWEVSQYSARSESSSLSTDRRRMMLMIKVRCKCGRGLKVKDSAAGRRIKCPDCGKGVAEPEPEDDYGEEYGSEDDYGDRYEDEYESPRPRRRSTGSSSRKGKGKGKKKSLLTRMCG